jgi:hypothetical protein
MERMKQITISTFFLMLLIAGIFFSGCISDKQEPENGKSPTEVNASAIAIALNDSRMKLYLAHDGSYEITFVGPTSYESGHSVFNVTGVEIDSPYDVYDVYVNVTNGTVDSIWSRPKRGPEPTL